MAREPLWWRYRHFWRRSVPRDVDDELRFHFESRVEDLAARGMTPDEARAQAAAEFGDVADVRARLEAIDRAAELRRGRAAWWEGIALDARHALRGLRRSPGLALSVVATLALGIGAAAGMYGVMSRLLLQPPPWVADPSQVVKLFHGFAEPGEPATQSDGSSYPAFEDLRAHARSLASLAAYTTRPLAVGDGPSARLLQTTMVSAGFWRTLGVRPRLGRFFGDEESHPATGARVVVLSYGLWQRDYGGDADVSMRTLRINGQPYRIVGVAPRGFRGIELTSTDVWLPLFAYGDGGTGPVTWQTMVPNFFLQFVGRLAPGASPAAASAELTVLDRAFWSDFYKSSFHREYPASAKILVHGVTGATGHDGAEIPEARVARWLSGIGVLLLVIAAANVVGLLLLRAMRRRREVAVRIALGVSRRRLAMQLIVEGAVLTLLGGIGAFLLLLWGPAAALRLLLPRMAWESSAILDHATLGAIVVGLLAVFVLAGIAPLLWAGVDVGQALRDGTSHGATHRALSQSILLGVQAALSVVLLLGAGLFVKSLERMKSQDLGIDTGNVLAVHVDFVGSSQSRADRTAFYDRALERVSALPGVERASLALTAPLTSARGGSIFLPGQEKPITMTGGGVPFVNYVYPGFFGTVGLRLQQGRDFTDADRDSSANVIVIDVAMAGRFWPGRSPVGECVQQRPGDVCTTIVGVVENAHLFEIREEHRLQFYRPLRRSDLDDRSLMVRVDPGARDIEGTIRRAVLGLGADVPYVDVKTLASVLQPQLQPFRLGAAVFTACGVLAVLLAAIGLASAVAYAVTQRSREIGVRMAIGARGRDVIWLFVRGALRTGSVGVAAGSIVALLAGGWIADMLYEVSPHDAVVFAVVTGLVLVVCVLASLLTARRASRIDPMVVLRLE